MGISTQQRIPDQWIYGILVFIKLDTLFILSFISFLQPKLITVLLDENMVLNEQNNA
jgi:hypothetical protein